MEKTAVELLFEKIKSYIDAEDGSVCLNWLHNETLKECNEVFKFQITKAYRDGKINQLENSEIYYNKKFNK